MPRPALAQFTKHGCALSSVNASVCDDLAGQMDELTKDLDPYALDFPICKDASLEPGRRERLALMRKVMQVKEGGQKRLGAYFPHYKPCTDNYMNSYLNTVAVQKAIHVKQPGSVDWEVA